MAYCHLAAALRNEATRGVYKNVSEVLARSMELAQKAVALDDSLAQAHITLGFQHTLRRDFDRAVAEGERAVALEPNSAEIVAGLAAMLERADRLEEAMPLFKKAMRLSPIPNLCGCSIWPLLISGWCNTRNRFQFASCSPETTRSGICTHISRHCLHFDRERAGGPC